MHDNGIKIVKDQMGYPVEVAAHPKIVSLVPSQTELLFDLGLEDQIVGVTKFCIHPRSQVKGKPKIGGTKKFRFDAIDQLQPDLIIGNKEENYQEGIEKLKTKYPVWMSNITTLEEAVDMIRSVGIITGTDSKANQLTDKIANGLSSLKKQPTKRVLYFIWQKPYMVVGSGTFIDEMMERIGLINIAADRQRYPELTPEEINELQPDLILLSSEPYPFKEKHVADFRQLCPQAEIKLVDGEMFSWYGSRLVKAIDYFNELVC